MTWLTIGGASAQADTFTVPGDFPNVQAALDAADAAGGADTIALAAGTYRENLRVNPQAVTITAPAGSLAHGAGCQRRG